MPAVAKWACIGSSAASKHVHWIAAHAPPCGLLLQEANIAL